MPSRISTRAIYETALGSAELITEVRVPIEARRRAAYLKCTTRSADDWPALGVAVALDRDERVVREARVVVSAATDKATRLPGVEALLRGHVVDAALLERAGEAAATEANVVSSAARFGGLTKASFCAFSSRRAIRDGRSS